MIPRIVLDCERMKHSNTGLYHYCLHLGRQLQKNLVEPHEKLTFYSPLNAVNKFRRDSDFLLQNSLQKFYMLQVF